jgi:hypothetical protein
MSWMYSASPCTSRYADFVLLTRRIVRSYVTVNMNRLLCARHYCYSGDRTMRHQYRVRREMWRILGLCTLSTVAKYVMQPAFNRPWRDQEELRSAKACRILCPPKSEKIDFYRISNPGDINLRTHMCMFPRSFHTSKKASRFCMHERGDTTRCSRCKWPRFILRWQDMLTRSAVQIHTSCNSRVHMKYRFPQYPSNLSTYRTAFERLLDCVMR